MSDGGELVSFVLPARCDDQIVQAHVDDDGDLTLLDYDLDEDIALEEMGYPASECLVFVREYEEDPVAVLLSDGTLNVPKEWRVLIAISIADHAVKSFNSFHGKDFFSDAVEDRDSLKDIILMSGNIDRASQAMRLVERARHDVELAQNRRDVAENDTAFRIAYSNLLISQSVLSSMKALHSLLYGFPTLMGTPDEAIRVDSAMAASDAVEAAFQRGVAERRKEKATAEEKQWQLDYVLGFLTDHLEDDE